MSRTRKKPVADVVRVRIPYRLESEANGRGHTLARARKVAERRGLARRALAAEVGRWTVPDPSKTEKAAARIARALAAGRRPRRSNLEPVRLVTPVVVTLTRVAPCGLDDDNLLGAFKNFRDGVADALGSDDRTPMIEWRYGERKGLPAVREGRKVVVPAEYAVEIEIAPRGST